MEYWQGWMNWSLHPNWKCETCGKHTSLTWGLIHGECRCDDCHTQYWMRDHENNNVIVDIPISALKEEYKLPAKIGFELFKKPIDEFDDDMWDEAIEKSNTVL